MNAENKTWEQTIEYIRTQPEYKELVEEAYFDSNLSANVERFKKSSEFETTLQLIKEYAPNAKSIIDIGAGNGISTIAFAMKGFDVISIEPDPSATIGAGAIRTLVKDYALSNVEVYEKFAEELNLPENNFDVVYARQSMHHAYDLQSFINECSRVLKKGGILITVRDHVVFDHSDKQFFLKEHPLHKFYGGENAFHPNEYKNAFLQANLKLEKELKYFDSPINYFPAQYESKISKYNSLRAGAMEKLGKKIGPLAQFDFIKNLYLRRAGLTYEQFFNETKVAGRMYTYISKKI
jgi:ubiquinone/menaquinone biosynthesis C-methylase UbiE